MIEIIEKAALFEKAKKARSDVRVDWIDDMYYIEYNTSQGNADKGGFLRTYTTTCPKRHKLSPMF